MDYFKKPCTQLNIENSLPPPSLPPPMLPPDALNVLLNGPKLPPRPNEMVHFFIYDNFYDIPCYGIINNFNCGLVYI